MKRAICGAVLAVVAAGCGKSDPAQNGALDTIVYARGEDSKKLDPADIEDGESANVVTQIFDTLVQFAPDSSQVVPALAQSWSASADGKVRSSGGRRRRSPACAP